MCYVKNGIANTGRALGIIPVRQYNMEGKDYSMTPSCQPGFVSATTLVVASMIGSGVFTTRGFLLAGLLGTGILPTNGAPQGEEERFTTARQHMIQTQLTGFGRGITNARVLTAMGKVPRQEFVPERNRFLAYTDGPLPIGHGQTISQPYIVAFMTEQLDPQPTDRVLEIGTGSGYQAAVFAELVRAVYTIEIVEPLGHRAESTLQRLNYTNVNVRIGDGYKGWPEAAPFDAIIVTCAPERVPQPLVEQLKDGGRMIIPIGGWGDQMLVLFRKVEGHLKKQAVLPVRFVPMTGDVQRDENHTERSDSKSP